jgi:endonuclease/exonuclease/phosphatase family metal-dependent hydrolase
MAAGTELILLGDFNETLGESFHGLDALINKYALLDLMPYHHGIDGEVETYARGSKRLDYAFGTQILAESIVRIGYTPYNFVITSDHHGLFIDFNAESFMGGDPSQLMSHALRGIKSSDPKKMQTIRDCSQQVSY